MAAEYFLYTTLYNNTLVDRSNTSFAPFPPNTGEIYLSFFIPTNQPLYLYRESGGTIVENDQDTINDYLSSIAPAPEPEDPVEYQDFTGYTATTDTKIDTKIDKVTGAEGQVPVFISGGNLESSNYTISELLNQYANVLIVAKSGATYSTINSAIAVATSDDVIFVKPGVYEEDITINKNVNLVGSCGKKTKLSGITTFTNSSNSIIFKNFGFYNENNFAVDVQCGDDDGKVSLIDCYLDTVWNSSDGQSLTTSRASIKLTRGQLAVSRGRYTNTTSGDNTNEHNSSIYWLTGGNKVVLNSFGAFNTITNTTDARQNLEVLFNNNTNTGSNYTFKNGNIKFYGVVDGNNYVAPFYSTYANGEYGIVEGNLIEINDTGNAYCAFNYDANIRTIFSNNSIIPNNVTDLYAAWSDSGDIDVVQCYFDTDSQPQVSGNVNYGITNNIGAFLSGKLSVDNKINLGTYTNTTGTDGDLWWTGTALNFRSGSTTTNLLASGGGTWGSITGTLSSQTDLQNALNLKLNSSVFNIYTGTTLPANYYNKTQINVYTGATATAIGTKQNTITGGATTITTSDLTVSRALVSDASGKVGVSTVTSTQLGYVAGVTSAIQTQLNLKAPLASPALTGTPTAPTATIGTNTTQLATTAYYIGSAANTNPVMDGTVAIGTSTRFARQDHVHASNTAKANLAGGAAFTGVITVPKPAINDNTTCVATTSWYISQAGTASPLMNNTVAVGTSNLFSRQDHVHPVDTSRVAKAGDTMTGNLTVPKLYMNAVSTGGTLTDYCVVYNPTTCEVRTISPVGDASVYCYSDKRTTQNNTTTTNATYLTETWTLPDGYYEYEYNALYGQNSSNRCAVVCFLFDGAVVGYCNLMKTNDTNTVVSAYVTQNNNVNDGNHTAAIVFRQLGGGTASVYSGAIRVQKIGVQI